MQYTPATTPESYPQLIKRGLTLYRKAFRHVILFALLTAIAVFLPRLINLIWQYNFFAINTSHPYLNRVCQLVFTLIDLTFFTAILWRLQCRMVGIKDTLLKDFITACKKLPRIFIAGLIQSFCLYLISLVGVVILLILLPGNLQDVSELDHLALFLTITLFTVVIFYVFYLFYFYLPLILTESRSILGALKRSVILVHGNFWRTLIFQATPWLTYLILLVVLRSVFHIDLHIYFIEIKNVTLSSTSLHILIFTLFVPWVAINLLIQVHDLELRKGLI